MKMSDASIFLLDAFTSIFIIYLSSCPDDVMFPPPPDSSLRYTVNERRQKSKIAPTFTVFRESNSYYNKNEMILFLNKIR